MDNRKSASKRQMESFYRASRYVTDAKAQKTPLSREFLRKPYGLEVKK